MNPLDNPIHAALHSVHRRFAIQADGFVRYPPEVAPFCAVPDADADVSAAVATLLAPGESTYLLGIAPRALRDAHVIAYHPLAQMVCDEPLAAVPGPAVIPLTDEHRDDVMTLTALVYPHYFRPRTMEMGRYFGLYESGRLAAMIGERLGSDTTREISAVCTHPDFNGRGFARRLMALLTNDLLARGLQPYLHVSHENARAKALYLRVGFRVRREIGFFALRR